MSDTKISEARNLLAEAFGCDPEELLDGEVRAVRAVLALQSVRPQPAELAEQQGVDPDIARAISSKDLYQVLMDVQNGIDSPALTSMANGAIQMIDKARNALAATGKQVGEVPEDVVERCRTMPSDKLLDCALQVYARSCRYGTKVQHDAAMAYAAEIIRRIDGAAVQVGEVQGGCGIARWDWDDLSMIRDAEGDFVKYSDYKGDLDAIKEITSASNTHPDNLAVDNFAESMKQKMYEARVKGRSGWEDPSQCSSVDLTRLLRDHVEKGDPRDVANFCMMLHQRGESIVAYADLPEIIDGRDAGAGVE